MNRSQHRRCPTPMLQMPYPRAGIRCILPVLAAFLALLGAPPSQAKEFLTDKEIEKIQETQEIDKRTKIYLEAADLRLKTVEDRINGKESAEGDPLEFYSIEEMLDGYHRILRSVMFNMDDAFQSPSTDRGKLEKALKNLKDSAGKAAKQLQFLKRLTEEKRNEEAWTLVNRAVDITEGAREGAELGLTRFSTRSKPR